MKWGSWSLCSASLLSRLAASMSVLRTSYPPPDNLCCACRQRLCASCNRLHKPFGVRCSDPSLGSTPQFRFSRCAERELHVSSCYCIRGLETDNSVGSHAWVNEGRSRIDSRSMILYSIIAISSIIDATMLCPHVTISLRTHNKYSHTDPADMCPTRSALYVIAAFRLLNCGPTLWAISRTILLLLLLESVVAKFSAFVLVAREAFMVDGSALSTD